jgi:hypothetical protein
MEATRYSQLYNKSKITELNHDEQIELIKLSTQILYNLMDSHIVKDESLFKITKTLELKL